MCNHIITLAVQAHNGEQSETHNSKLKPTEKEQTHKIFLSVCSFCLYKGFCLAHIVFDRSNVMLALLLKCKFSVKDITLFLQEVFYILINNYFALSQTDTFAFFLFQYFPQDA